ncbi:AbrB/MazE/SpoVT family DNA-binding domain-containing protein [Desulfobacterota bacterium AH_259_B03_O07]|nr:AbrB/MazE/SpoVT family DNA-binding domain-containing protein [Desulfobacterota bacterium AH_259_B03_O07]
MQKHEEYIRTVTQKGQVTIPAEIRNLLGVGPNDKVAFIMENDQILLTSTKSVVERTAGAFKSDKPTRTVAELREDAEHAIAEEAVERVKR